MTGPVHYSDGTFPPDGQIKWENLIPQLGRTAAAVARYDGLLGAIPNPDILLAPLMTQEAVHSSRIEGIRATMEEVLEFEAGSKPGSNERRDDIHEVLNCRAAMRVAEKMLDTLPLSQRVVRTAHARLMSGARGKGKSPGEFRKISNWIGSPGCAIEEAKFVPVAAQSLPDAIQRWENFMHSDAPDQLVQLAIVHAEFEAIHPFLDGNGRLGRMLIPLFMWQKGLIRRPMFCISAFLESHRDAYYERLLSVSRDDDWTGWSEFFLEAVRVQAEDNLEKAQTIFNLYDGLKQRVADMTRSHYAIHVLDFIFSNPVFNRSVLVSTIGFAPSTSRRILDVLCEKGILKEIAPSRGNRPSVLLFPDLVEIVEGKSSPLGRLATI